VKPAEYNTPILHCETRTLPAATSKYGYSKKIECNSASLLLNELDSFQLKNVERFNNIIHNISLK